MRSPVLHACMHSVLYIYSAIGWPSWGMLGVATSVFSWPLLYFVILFWIGVGETPSSFACMHACMHFVYFVRQVLL